MKFSRRKFWRSMALVGLFFCIVMLMKNNHASALSAAVNISSL
ncbi:hypothetical protein JCM19236_2943 [Vibrio sp. JCM 19236]|nr:hypothetical protein JCM19236_2943 [Vibrio sp. JCM 19236]